MEVCAALSTESYSLPNVAVQCALLHDVIEDTEIGFEELETQFGQVVAEGVLALTKDPNLSKSDAMDDSLARILRCPAEVWIVKLSDRITNLQKPPESWSAKKRTYYVEEAETILKTLGPASAYLTNRLARKIEVYRKAWCGSQ